jgi:TolB protein
MGASCFAADIQIVGEGKTAAVPIRTTEFRAGASDAEALFLHIVRVNLDRWGWFRVSDGDAASYSLQGGITVAGDRFSLDARVMDVRTGRSVFRKRMQDDVSNIRMTALTLVDGITEAIHDVPGVAATKIAFVGSVQGRKDLFMVGADGQAMMQLTQDAVPCFRPSWHPQKDVLYYTSFVRGFPDIYQLDIERGMRSVVSKESGINAGTSVAPDGNRLALILSRSGNPEVYIRAQPQGALTRITRTAHFAEASPDWSPDGRNLVFVSDMQGGPHLFTISSEGGGNPRRISRSGSQNVSPDWGPDGRIIYSSRRYGRFQLVVYDPETGEESQLTTAPVDHENPSWARDARHVVYAKRDGRISALYIMDTHTGTEIRLTTRAGDWYFPAWSLH